MNVRWGILGTGRIAHTFAKAVEESESGKLVAVASRTRESADLFGREFGLIRLYEGYDGLLDDPEVDSVYISLPNHLHARWTVRCAQAGKHILCEKPLAVNYPEAMTAVEAARSNDVFLMEAFMYRCHPQTTKLVELIAAGEIGEVRHIEAHFSYNMGGPKEDIRRQSAAGGGGIMDVGCYCMSMARLIAGAATGTGVAEPVVESDGYRSQMRIKAFAAIGAHNRVDEWASAVVDFPGNILATLTCGLQVRIDPALRIWGSAGHIVVPNPWFPGDARYGGEEGSRILVFRDGDSEELVVGGGSSLYAIEADTVARYIEDRRASYPCMSWADSLGNMKALDVWRKEIGLIFDCEKEAALTVPTSGRSPARASDHNMRYGSVEGVDKPISSLVMGTMIFKPGELPLACSLLDYFYERGGNCLDTAHVYNCEETVGRWIGLRGLREDLVVIGKGARDEAGTPEGLTRQLEETLEKMRLDYLDIYLMHTDNPDVPVGEFVDCLNDHKRAGLIRAFGGSNWSIERLEAANAYADAHDKTGFAASSPNFSLAAWNEPMWPGCISASDPKSRLWYEETRMPLFAWSSQATGFFSGRYSAEDRDVPSLAPIVRTWFNEGNFERLERSRELARGKGATATQIALAYVLQQSFPGFALIGPQSIEELREAFPALDIELTREELLWLNLERDMLEEG
jgi:predicted dehydrogenase/aryl-alcohol dehydrogenase-like predicted oxidoreductase